MNFTDIQFWLLFSFDFDLPLSIWSRGKHLVIDCSTTFFPQNYKAKPMFFVRKFEPIISQEIVNQVDMLLGKDLSGKVKYSDSELIHSPPSSLCSLLGHKLTLILISSDLLL